MALKKMSNAEYHALDYVSKSHLDEVNKSPFHYWDKYINPNRVIQEPTKQMILGSAFHTLVLEPELFDKEYIVESANAPKRPTETQRNAKKPSNQTLSAIAFWDSFDDKAKGKTFISLDKFSIVLTTLEFGSLSTAKVMASSPFIRLKLVGFL